MPLSLSRPALRRGGYGAVDTALVVMAVSLLIVVVVSRYQRTANEANRTALRAELAALRSTTELFRATQGRCPAELKELLGAEYALPYSEGFVSDEAGGPGEPTAKDLPELPRKTFFDTGYLKAYSLDGDGNILDPFGLPYLYNSADCTVRSRAPAYADW